MPSIRIKGTGRLTNRLRTWANTVDYHIGKPRVMRRSIGQINLLELRGNYLIGTKKGLYELVQGRLDQILRGDVYGIAVTSENEFYVYQQLAQRGRILRCSRPTRNDEYQVTIAVSDIGPGVHQIDVVDGDVVICDTYRNSLRVWDPNDGGSMTEYFPFGGLANGRNSLNYAHINSIYKRHGSLYVFCHNETKKTGRKSTVALLNSDFGVESIYHTEASSGHNIVPVADEHMYCDSLGKRLMLGRNVILEANHFTRGLSWSDEGLLVGGSDFGAREARTVLAGALYHLALDGETDPTVVPLPGMVQEIRRIDAPDVASSRGAGSLNEYASTWEALRILPPAKQEGPQLTSA